jgi:hypothetical protein
MNRTASLSREQADNIVRRSYQYVAMFNVIQKFALDPGSGGTFTDGFNKPKAMTALLDHTMKSIARPNNDTLYQAAVLDLRHDPVIIKFPAIDSVFVSLETSGYDHYCGIPLATSKGDFKKPVNLLFYTDRTEGYQGQQIKGVDRIVKVDCDFTVAFLRAMPHQADPARMARIIQALQDTKVVTLSEFQGKPAKDSSDVKFPAYGKTDGDVFANNLLEVMQFVFNHTTFAEVAKQALAGQSDPALQARVLPQMFMPKGQIDLETEVVQSVIGPIGQPGYQARYIPVATKDGKSMDALHDYVLQMSKDELPPATAFWSLTLYDLNNGFFIPNDRKKYSVGENAGLKLNADGGIEIYVSATKPKDVPEENWLPINRENIGIDGMFRIYAPDVEKMKKWTTPRFEMLSELSKASRVTSR